MNHIKHAFYLFFTLLLTNTMQGKATPLSKQYDLQTTAMQHVQQVKAGILTTNYAQVLQGLYQLEAISFDQIPAPLSLLYELTSSLQHGREDFLGLGFIDYFFIQLRRIAQQVWEAIVKKEKYVSAKTKQETVEKLQAFQKLLKPNETACARVIQNIGYITMIVKQLPEKTYRLEEAYHLIYNVVSAVTKYDTDALKSVLTTLYNNAKAFYENDVVTQITIVEALGKVALQGDQKAFATLVEFFNNPKTILQPQVMYEIVQAYGAIASSYYSDGNEHIQAKDAYQAFSTLLEVMNDEKFVLTTNCGPRVGATEQIILLQYRLQDKNAQQTVERYITALEKKVGKEGQQFLQKAKSTLGYISENEIIKNSLSKKGREQLYNMDLVTKQTEKLYEKPQSKESQILAKLLKNQQEILNMLKQGYGGR